MQFFNRPISETKWIIFRIFRRWKNKILVLKRLTMKPRLPQNPDGKVYLHLGCGDINSPEFINVDSRPAPHVHYIGDVTDLSIFPDNYADLIYACHILEHIPRPQIEKTLWDWKRILKTGGILRLSVPDFDRIVDVYHDSGRDLHRILSPLMGSQNYPQNVHYGTYNRSFLREVLHDAGFRTVSEWNPYRADHHDFTDCSTLRIDGKDKQYPVSLNLEAVK